MNQLVGKITEIQSHEGISLVKLRTESNINFTSILLDTPETADYLKIGNSAKIIFKETEVIISKDLNPKISVQNQISCKIQSIKVGVVLSQIFLTFAGEKISSIITSNAYRQLNLSENDEIVALIKTNEISLSPND